MSNSSIWRLWRFIAVGGLALAVSSCDGLRMLPPLPAPETQAAVIEPPPAAAIAPIRMVTVWEGGCFYAAGCPTYTIKLTPNGAFLLEAANKVRVPGTSTGTLGPGGFSKIEAALAAAGFETLPPRLDAQTLPKPVAGPGCMVHMPGLIVTVERTDGAKREVYWDQGCRSEAGQKLRDELRAAFGFDALIKASN